MSTNTPEAIFEPEDDLTPREREMAAHHAAMKHLDPEDVLHAACAILPFQQPSALLDLVQEQMVCPFEDIARAYIHPDMAQRIARAFLASVAVSIDDLANLHVYAV